jgi:hypothetical protein
MNGNGMIAIDQLHHESLEQFRQRSRFPPSQLSSSSLNSGSTNASNVAVEDMNDLERLTLGIPLPSLSKAKPDDPIWCIGVRFGHRRVHIVTLSKRQYEQRVIASTPSHAALTGTAGPTVAQVAAAAANNTSMKWLQWRDQVLTATAAKQLSSSSSTSSTVASIV